VRTQASWALGEMHTAPAQLALSQVANAEAARPILQTAGTAARPTVGSTDPDRQKGAPLPAAVPGALAQTLLNRWILAALATVLALAILAATVLLVWNGPRRHAKPC